MVTNSDGSVAVMSSNMEMLMCIIILFAVAETASTILFCFLNIQT